MTIFIRTYKNDLPWLAYCLRSIQKFVTGYDKIVICIPENQKRFLDPWGLTKEEVVTCPVYPDDYIGQQIDKMKADQYGERITYVDSDCIFTRPLDLAKTTPVMYKTEYPKVGDGAKWKGITEKALNMQVDYEYMRRHPLTYSAEVIRDCREYMEQIHGVTLEQYALSQPFRGFSEFNILGAFAEKFGGVEFIDTEQGTEEPYIRQFWSWGGITPEVQREIEEVLK